MIDLRTDVVAFAKKLFGIEIPAYHERYIRKLDRRGVMKEKKPTGLSELFDIVELPLWTGIDMSDLKTRAKDFATERHTGQTRKYTGEAYICHPAALVEIVRGITHTPEMIAAAWLHDTVEDTETTLEEIKEHFGDQVSVLVEMLTDVSRPFDGNRAARKALDREHTAKASPDAKTIKLADLIHNSTNIMEFDPAFAKIYLAEKKLLLEVLTEGDNVLWERANIVVMGFYET